MELGKIEKPDSKEFKENRKLYVISTLPFNELSSEIKTEKVEEFWKEVDNKLLHFESRFGKIDFIYIDEIYENENKEISLEFFEKFGKNSNQYKIIKRLTENGARLKVINKPEHIKKMKYLYDEYSMSFIPEIKKFHEECYGGSFDKWRKYLIDNIEKTQKEINEYVVNLLKNMPKSTNGILIITEGRVIEYPEAMDVFLIRPPVFDEMLRSLARSSKP